MLELSPARKNKVNLTDYNCQQDIENRMLMADFSAFDVDVLEEILFSPLKLSLKKFARSLDCEESVLSSILQKLAQTGLLSIQGDSILVDKEKRKYFEFQIHRFSPDFKPDMEFMQGLLKKVPIHILPSWYSIPRTSNNIFESIVEKYLLTPHIFQRYLMELNFGDPVINGMIQDVFSSPQLKVSSSDLIAKYNLARRDFEEILLLLEFNFVCCLTYERADDHWLEFVTPFYEWQQYLFFLKSTEASPIESDAPVIRYRDRDFAFIEDLTALLKAAQKKPIPLPHSLEPASLSAHMRELAPICSLPLETPEDLYFAQNYLSQLLQKLCAVKLADQIDHRLYALETANDWLDLSLENRALYLYRHSLNRILHTPLPADVSVDRNIHEAEKSIKRIFHGKWVYFEDFVKGVLVPLSEDSVVMLKKTGKHWKYTLPSYTEGEKALLQATIFEWLFEVGMVAIGSCHGRPCFSVTSFGRFFFEN
jgi:predicted transcriptional regulator